jgi:uncharacterized membrane protein
MSLGRAILWSVRGFSVLWVALALAAPILTALGWSVAGAHIYALLRYGCSDIPGHSIWVCNHPMGLCARHAALYTGVALATFLGPWLVRRGPSRLCSVEVALLGLVPVVLDGGLEMFGSWTPNTFTRVATGLLAGAGLGLYLAGSLATWSDERRVAMLPGVA